MIPEIIFIFFLSLLLTTLLVPVGRYGTYRTRFGRRRLTEDGTRAEFGVGLTMVFFFFILFPLLLAGNLWVRPYGPAFMEISWVPITVLGLLLFLLIASISPRYPKTSATEPDTSSQVGVAAGFGVMFFLLLIGAVIAIIASFG